MSTSPGNMNFYTFSSKTKYANRKLQLTFDCNIFNCISSVQLHNYGTEGK